MGYLPNRPTGDDAEALFAQAQWDKTHGSKGRLNNSTTVKVRRTHKGIFFAAAPHSKGGVAVKMFAISDLVNDNYFTAKEWNGSSAGATVTIAKQVGARLITDEMKDGHAFVYTPIDDNNRISNGTDPQTVFPAYVKINNRDGLNMPDARDFQQIVFAAKSKNGTGIKDASGAKIDWIEIGPARSWINKAIGADIQAMIVTGESGDYVFAQSVTLGVNPTNGLLTAAPSGNSVRVAKPYGLRSTNKPSAPFGGTAGTYVIFPAYVNTDISGIPGGMGGTGYPQYIWVESNPIGGTGVGFLGPGGTWGVVTNQDTNRDARRWYWQKDICIDSVQQFQMFAASPPYPNSI